MNENDNNQNNTEKPVFRGIYYESRMKNDWPDKQNNINQIKIIPTKIDYGELFSSKMKILENNFIENQDDNLFFVLKYIMNKIFVENQLIKLNIQLIKNNEIRFEHNYENNNATILEDAMLRIGEPLLKIKEHVEQRNYKIKYIYLFPIDTTIIY